MIWCKVRAAGFRDIFMHCTIISHAQNRGMSAAQLSVLVIDENSIRASIIEAGLRDAGHERVTVITDVTGIARRIPEIAPDVIVIDLENPNRDMLEAMFQLSRTVQRPIAMFVDQSDQASIEAAVDAGVSAYVVDGLRRERVKPILDMAVSRFNAFLRMARELDEALNELADRKIIDRAKGLLMKSNGIGEQQAYALLRNTAMNQNRKIAEIARLRAADIPVAVVPGITAASAMTSALGVSLTHRDHAQSVRFVTGHSRKGELPDDINWRAIADPKATTIFYMGGRTAGRIAESLARHGMAADTPVTVCASVSRKSQKQWNGELRDLGAGMDLVGYREPVLIGVGAVFAAGRTANTSGHDRETAMPGYAGVAL
jgi:response regulator NasT